ncbi:MAG: hypothetical protein PF486_15550 [Prolixibacteraceae bacterium]|jgi:hypothetical protein|nr:hypothetical protein [Prolixibacteraceae bacterium]
MKEILRSQWNYMLCEKDEKLVFSVICGSVAIFEINIFLNEDELKKYNERGEEFLNELAEHVRNNLKSYNDRYIDFN